MVLVSGGVSLIVSGQQSAPDQDFPIDGFLLTLLSGMLAGLKWTLSQVRHGAVQLQGVEVGVRPSHLLCRALLL